MKLQKVLSVTMIAVLLLGVLAGCGGAGGNADTAPSTNTAAGERQSIKIGFVNPTTGVLAGFGEGSPWVEQHVVDYVNEQLGGIYIEEYDKKLPVELIYYDTESNSTKAADLTQKLIQEDGVDLILARHTPETVNPVLSVCERFEIPCVSTDAPMDAVMAEGPYDWSFHGHWDLQTMYECYSSMWKTAGFGEGTKVGLFFANDADGVAWNSIFTQQIPADGFTLVDPGMFPANTQDFSEIIQKFKAEGVEILAGTATNPDFSTLWKQCKQMGFEPKFVTMGKAFLLKSDAMAIGPDLMDGLCCEVWWSPTHPWESALTGETPASIAEIYKAETGQEITTPMGAKYYGVEIALDALTRAASLDKTAIRDAIAQTDLETMFGHVVFEEDHGWRSSLTGGQWVKEEDDDLQLVVIDNTLYPNIPTTGEWKPLQ